MAPTQPLSSHWADTTAFSVIKTKGDKPQYVVSSGITPSGKVHVGNFREVLTVALVARALRDLGKDVRFLYSWDNFDTFRKVPKNLPDPAAFTPYLHQPIMRIPDPWGQATCYAQKFIQQFEDELKLVGMHPEYLYQESKYSSGTYATEIRQALEATEAIKEILNRYRTAPLEDSWLPTAVYCSQCQKDEMTYQTYPGEWAYQYKCASCGFEETLNIRQTRQLKLSWRVDWPMRWHFEKVDFEPGGKDHSSEGGSFDTGAEIIQKVWGVAPPVYLQYDFIKIKGGSGKMSSSSGELLTISDVCEVYEPQVLRWIFANHRPNHDFAISFDEDVIKVYEEFDKCERSAFTESDGKAKWQQNRRIYEFSLVGKASSAAPQRAGFRALCNHLQLCDGDIEKTHQRFYPTFVGDAHIAFVSRATRAWEWLQKHAPSEFRYQLHRERVEVALSAPQVEALALLRTFLSQTDLATMDTKSINEALWAHVVNQVSCEPKEVFTAIYLKLIGRDQGPRLPSFLQEIGTERLLELL